MPSQPENQRRRLRWCTGAGLTALFVLAGLSVRQGFRNAALRSQDFQWSGVRILMARVDPWANSLAGDPRHMVHLSQIPNYLPVLYVLLAPLGLLPLERAQMAWACLNVVFAVISGVLAARFYKLPRWGAAAVVLLLLAATPSRQTLGNGQQSMLVLVLWCASLLAARLTPARAMGAGVSYLKFNFAPPLAIYLLLRRGVRALAWSLVPSILATLAVWLWLTHGRDAHELLALITGPVAVSRSGGYFPDGGNPNLMDVLQVPLLPSYLPGTFLPSVVIVPTWATMVTFSAALIACFALFWWAMVRHRGSSVQWQLALLGTASFGLFKHHSYDGVVLLLPLCHALRLWRHRRAQVALGALAYTWYLQKLLESVAVLWKYLFLIDFAVLMVLLAMTCALREAERELSPAWDVDGPTR